MSKKEKLLDAIKNNPKDVRFEDLLRLIEAFGFIFDRQGGTSHRIYAHPRNEIPPMNVQEGKNGKAKPYQVKQILDIAEQFGLEII